MNRSKFLYASLAVMLMLATGHGQQPASPQIVDAISSDYQQPFTIGHTYPFRRPFVFQNYFTKRFTQFDSFFGLSVEGMVQHGGTNTQFAGMNYSLYDGTFTANTDGQAGGLYNMLARHYGHGDLVGNAQNLFCSGVSRGQDEGCESHRWNTAFHLDLWGIEIGKLARNANGEVIFSPGMDAGVPRASKDHALYASYENGPIIDTNPARRYSAGSIARIGQCGSLVLDPSAICIAGDAASKWSSKFGVTSFTTLAEDIAIPVPGKPDPLAAGAHCAPVRVANSSIFTPGGLMTISSKYDDTELVTVLAAGSGTVTACFAKSHSAGEMLSAGGSGPGHAISCAADDQAPGALNFYDQGPNPTTLRLAYPILGVLAGNVIVTTFPSGASPTPHYLPTNCFAANMPRISPSFTPELKAGAIASWTVGNVGTIQTADDGNGGGSTMLPPPTISFAGSTCKGAPPTAIATVNRSYVGWSPRTTSAGSGCTSLTVTVQGTDGNPYPNGYTIYPMAWARGNQDPNWTLIADADPTQVPPNNAITASTDGYMLTGGAILTTSANPNDGFAVGDPIEATYSPMQRITGNLSYQRWMMGQDSGGAVDQESYQGFGGQKVLHQMYNLTPSATYYGSAANGFAQAAGGIGNFTAPTAWGTFGSFSIGQLWGQPPRGRPGNETANALIQVDCLDATAPCANGEDVPWNVFEFNDNQSQGVNFAMMFDPIRAQLQVRSSPGSDGKPGFVNPQFITSANCSSTGSPAACGAAVIGQVQVAAGSTTLVIDTTAVTNGSRFWFSYSTSGIAAPTNMNLLLPPYVSAIASGSSFTITLPVGPATNAVRVNYGFADSN